MDENGNVYYVDTRNADPRDHRVVRPTVVGVRQPGYLPPAASPGDRTYVTAAPASYAPAGYPPAGYAGPAPYVAPQAMWGSPNPAYLPPPAWGWGQPWGQPGTLGSLFGGLNGINIGSLVDLIGQGFAAIRSLPTPPTASGDSATDVANLTLYQTALAEHGKSDEQIRTAVHIIGKLLGA